MSTFSTISVLNDLLWDLQDKPDSECPQNYIKALENAIELFKNHSNIIPNNLLKFKDQYLPQFSVQFITDNGKLHEFYNRNDFEWFIINYSSNDEQYIIVEGTTFYTELCDGVHTFSPIMVKKIFAQYPKNNV